MKILLVHNRYQQKGGEDSVVQSERNLLTANGVQVEVLETNNDSIVGIKGKLDATVSVFYSPRGVNLLKKSLAEFQPDIVHVHNWFPTFSPAIFWACKNAHVPVVHTLHNYRLLCAKASFYRNGGVCEDCLGTVFRMPGILHGCYRNSRSGTAVATAGMLSHWKFGTWHRAINRFIALSEFAKNKLIEGGLPPSKITVKPNCLEYDPGMRAGDGGFFLYTGRLTEEKGVLLLLQCWRRNANLPLLRMIGTGPLEEEVKNACKTLKNVEWLGARSSEEVLDMMGRAKALICPSLWYEGMPRVVIEAMAVGTPVIASQIGTYPEMIIPNKTGLLFEGNSAKAMSECVRELDACTNLLAWRREVRNHFVVNYSADAGLKKLIQIYKEVNQNCPNDPQ
jgi:glycosyltransferase involved in cell wall biosynthesis